MRSAVLDVGTGFTKAGFSGEEAPREVFRSCTGVPRHAGVRATLYGHPSDIVAGDEAFADRGLLELLWPVQKGRVADYAQLERLLYYTLYGRLRLVPDVTPLLMLEPADQTRESREKTAEILFESFNVPLAGTLNTATATVYSTGRTTGLVVDSGAGKTMISAVCDGYTLAHTARPSMIAGNCLTDDLFSFLRSRGYPLSVPTDWELVNEVKETLCHVSTTGAEADAGECKVGDQTETLYPGETDGGAYYQLPDGERIFLLEAETQLAERLFKPSVTLPGAEEAAAYEAPATPTGYSSSNPSMASARKGQGSGWADTICDVIAACPSPATRAALYSSVVLGGGTTMLRDVERRLQRELTSRTRSSSETGGDDNVVAKVVAFPNRAQAAWIGGSVWSCSAAFPALCLSKADYYEGGAGSVHKYAF